MTNGSLPLITSLTAPYWEGARKGKLLLQFCNDCKRYQWYPRDLCAKCGSKSLTWKESSGRGKIYSYTVIRAVVDNTSDFQSKIPFALALIDLEEGVRAYSDIYGYQPEQVQIGKPVEVYFDKVNEEITLPRFRLSGRQIKQLY